MIVNGVMAVTLHYLIVSGQSLYVAVSYVKRLRLSQYQGPYHHIFQHLLHNWILDVLSPFLNEREQLEGNNRV